MQLQTQPQLQSEKNPTNNNSSTPTTITPNDNSNLNDDLNNSRTPDSGVFSQGPHPAVASVTAATNQYNNSNGLKFSYEPQIPQGISDEMSVDCRLLPTDMKYSPPSSPGSEAGSSRKRGRKSLETAKEAGMFTNGGIAPHMLGNQINPASGVSQKLSDQLKMEIQDHSIFTAAGEPPLIGVPFPGKLHVSIPFFKFSVLGVTGMDFWFFVHIKWKYGRCNCKKRFFDSRVSSTPQKPLPKLARVASRVLS